YSETPISSTVNLAQFLGVPVELTGTWNGSATAPAIDVTSAQVGSQSFSFAGQGRIGGSFRFTAAGTPGDLAINAGSLDRRFAVADPRDVDAAGHGAQFAQPAGIAVQHEAAAQFAARAEQARGAGAAADLGEGLGQHREAAGDGALRHAALDRGDLQQKFAL